MIEPFARVRVILHNKTGKKVELPDVEARFEEMMAGASLRPAGYIIDKVLCQQFIRHNPPEDIATELLMFFSKNDLQGFEAHVWGEWWGGKHQLFYVIPPLPEVA